MTCDDVRYLCWKQEKAATLWTELATNHLHGFCELACIAAGLQHCVIGDGVRPDVAIA